MAKISYDQDADLKNLSGKTIASIGYGNQGDAQSKNMRDSGLNVLIGNREDKYSTKARQDGFEVVTIEQAAERADILNLLIPDELLPEIYKTKIAPFLKNGQTLNFSHGYNIRFDLLHPPEAVNVVMVAPRMIGISVREKFIEGTGAPAFVAVERDATGTAWPITLALAKAIGSTKAGALHTTFAEETELDLFSEQAFWPLIIQFIILSYRILKKHGYQPEAILMEQYASGEAARVFQKMADEGIFKQMSHHSQTSQYGTMTQLERILSEKHNEIIENILNEIKNRSFARDWELDKKKGYPLFNKLKKTLLEHEINSVEELLRK